MDGFFSRFAWGWLERRSTGFPGTSAATVGSTRPQAKQDMVVAHQPTRELFRPIACHPWGTTSKSARYQGHDQLPYSRRLKACLPRPVLPDRVNAQSRSTARA